MSQENVEVIRRSIEHLNRAGEPAWELFDREISFTTRGEVESSGTSTGLGGLREVASRFAGVWESMRFEIRDVIDNGDALVVALHIYLRGKGSGVELETDEAWACWMRDGRFLRIEQYGDLRPALEAAGLSE